MSDEAPRIASYQADPGAVGRVLLLYSGGLDTSVMVHWIQERYGAEIVTLTVDLGQPGEDWEVIVGKARELGAVETIRADAREEFARDYVLPAIKANALYGGGYPLFTALARPLIAKLAVEHARAERLRHDRPRLHRQGQRPGADRRHDRRPRSGAQGAGAGAGVEDGTRGGDRLRARARDPDQGGERGRGAVLDRRQPLGALVGGALDRGPGGAHPRRRLPLVTRPELAPDEPELVRIGFEAGRPVSLDGEPLGLVELIERAAELGARHGAGIVDHIEDRIVGLKVRDIYEVPAAAVIMPAHRELEKLVSTIHQNNFKRALEDKWAYLCYAGLWLEPLRLDLDAFMESANAPVTGEVTVKLYKGSATVVARSSPNALYDQALASFGESGGEFSQEASPGFIELFTLQTRMAYRVRAREARVDD